MPFSAARYADVYKRFMGPLAKNVTLRYNNGTGFTSYYGVLAYVSRYKETDLVQGGSIEIGDLKVIIPDEYMPSGVRNMERKDRIDIDGRNYSVVHYDTETRSMGDAVVAIEISVRG